MSNKNQERINWHMQGAIAQIKAQYKAAVYLGESSKKTPCKPKQQQQQQQQRFIRGQHNSLIPRQFIDGHYLITHTSHPTATGAPLPTSALNLDTIDTVITDETKEEWAKELTLKKPTPSGTAQRFYQTQKIKNNSTLKFNRTLSNSKHKINSNSCNSTHNLSIYGDDTIQLLSNTPAPNFQLPTRPIQLKEQQPSELFYNRRQKSKKSLAEVSRTLSPNTLRALSSVKSLSPTSPPPPAFNIWVTNEDDVLRYGQVVPLIPKIVQPEDGEEGRRLSGRGNGNRVIRVVGMIVL